MCLVMFWLYLPRGSLLVPLSYVGCVIAERERKRKSWWLLLRCVGEVKESLVGEILAFIPFDS